MATIVLRNGIDRFKWQRPFTKGKFATATPWTSVKKKNLCFTYESRDTLKSFGFFFLFFSFFFFSVKTTSKLNIEHSVKLEIEI